MCIDSIPVSKDFGGYTKPHSIPIPYFERPWLIYKNHTLSSSLFRNGFRVVLSLPRKILSDRDVYSCFERPCLLQKPHFPYPYSCFEKWNERDRKRVISSCFKVSLSPLFRNGSELCVCVYENHVLFGGCVHHTLFRKGLEGVCVCVCVCVCENHVLFRGCVHRTLFRKGEVLFR